jgi:hypothetical protein
LVACLSALPERERRAGDGTKRHHAVAEAVEFLGA